MPNVKQSSYEKTRSPVTSWSWWLHHTRIPKRRSQTVHEYNNNTTLQKALYSSEDDDTQMWQTQPRSERTKLQGHSSALLERINRSTLSIQEKSDTKQNTSRSVDSNVGKQVCGIESTNKKSSSDNMDVKTDDDKNVNLLSNTSTTVTRPPRR